MLSIILLLLQEAEHGVPPSIYYNEYAYVPASHQMPYDSAAAAAAAENVQAQNSVAWDNCGCHFMYSSIVLSWYSLDVVSAPKIPVYFEALECF